MANSGTSALAAAIGKTAFALTGSSRDYDALLDRVGDARYVLLGEASHGTHEFYNERARITRRLIEEKGFSALAVEADWPDAYRVNRYVRGESADESANLALSGFERFPQWMWRNAVVLEFIDWLRQHNAGRPHRLDRVGFYGLDLYSLHSSIEAVIAYLERVDSPAAKRARDRYSCFDHYGEDTQSYGYATHMGLSESCQQEVVSQLIDLRRKAADYARRDGTIAEDEYFFAEQNARLAKNAEEYYRTMFGGRVSSWNLRDQHMADTLDELVTHLDRRMPGTKVVLWAHNSHLGDARATEMGETGEWNVGQLVRERHGSKALLIGFSTYTGHVTAASNWGEACERKRVRPGMTGSYEALFHEVDMPRFWLDLRGDTPLNRRLREPRLERAIGVIYRPQTERRSHYFHARLADQFDALIHIDQTDALQPLERSPEWDRSEVPETFPTGV